MKSTKAFGVLLIALMGVCLSTAQIANELARGGKVSWRFLSGNYEITGAINISGSISAGDPIAFSFQDLNNDGVVLDVLLDLRELIPDINLDYQIPLIATVISDSGSSAIIRWTAQIEPNQCIEVTVGGTTVQAHITRIEGSLQGLVTRTACQPDPLGLLPHNVTLRIVPNGGDEHNYLRARGYLFCIQQDNFLANARIYNMDWIGYGGGVPKSLGNVNGDCIVDDADLLQVLFAFGSSDPATDVNGDGIVDDADLLIVLFNFGTGG